MKMIGSNKQQFNDFRFAGLNARQYSNKYITMERINSDNTKIVVKVADCHLKKTTYGYALILDNTRVVFLKNWQVSQNYYGNEVLLEKQFFIVKEWGNWNDFGEEDEYCNFEAWLNVAKEQNKKDEDGCLINSVRWEI